MLNLVVLIGRVATDPELRYTPSGIAVTSFRIAVDRPVKPQEGQDREADFIDVVAWRQAAEFATNYLTKGRLIAVQGRLQIRSWVAQDGTKRYKAEVIASQLRGLDRPKEHVEPLAEAAPFEEPIGMAVEPASGPEPEDDFDPFAEE